MPFVTRDVNEQCFHHVYTSELINNIHPKSHISSSAVFTVTLQGTYKCPHSQYAVNL